MSLRTIAASCGVCALLLTGGCTSSDSKIGVVDMQEVVQKSTPGRKAQEHVDQLQKVYQQALNIVQKKVENYPDKEQAAQIVQNALFQFQNELEASKAQVAQIVSEQIRKVVSTYHNEHKFTLTVAKDNVLDYDKSVDITPAVITAFDSVQIQLPPLPKVNENPQLPAPKKEIAQPAARQDKNPAEPKKTPNRKEVKTRTAPRR